MEVQEVVMEVQKESLVITFPINTQRNYPEMTISPKNMCWYFTTLAYLVKLNMLIEN